jgi:DNA/RNA endonuclease YhcR with UshA esterase domain
MKGRVFTVRGTMGEPRSLMKGIIYPLNDGTGQIDLLLWDRLVPGPERDRLEPGRTVKATGMIGEYKGALQIVPANPQAVILE